MYKPIKEGDLLGLCNKDKFNLCSEDICFQDLSNKLKRLENQFISVTISGCCDIIQGRILRVDNGFLILVGEFGTRNIPIRSITSLDPCRILAYVTNFGLFDAPNNTISVIETTTDTVVDTITVGTGPLGIAITPNGQRVYVTNRVDDSVSVIDTATNKVIVTIPVGNQPSMVAVTPDGIRVYVGNSADNTISVIDTRSNTVIDLITLESGSIPIDVPFGITIANTPVGIRAYVANKGDNTVLEIDADPNSPTFNTVIDTITVGISPTDVAITPDGTTLYVTNELSGDAPLFGDVTIFDIATRNQNTIKVGLRPEGIGTANTPLGPRVYVSLPFARQISVIDADPNSPTFETVIATISKGVGGFPNDAAANPNGTKAYIPIREDGSNTVIVIDTVTNTVIGSIPVGEAPRAAAVGRVCSKI